MHLPHRAARWLLSALLTLGLPTLAQAALLKVVGWNDLGMHCMDSDYSVFSILPPFNTLHAQVIDTSQNKLVTSGVTLSFEALADLEGSRNTYSVGKTNFWDHAKPLYGVDLPPGIGLTGLGTAGVQAQGMRWQAGPRLWEAVGIPITPVDDNGRKNTYPMTRVVARDAGTGAELAQARVVLPVSDEMTCVACHASGAQEAAKPARGWLWDPRGADKDYRRNILARHDDQHLATARYRSALKTLGYDRRGLLASADAGHPVLCAACHASNALPGTGLTGISALTSATHTLHAKAINPGSGLPLGDEKDRGACYMCHPGAETKCLRGVMGNATGPDGLPAMQCQSCHSTMAQVGSPKRVGWLQQPTCQACHHDGRRDLTALNAKGQVKVPKDTRFATNPNVPAPGFNLYRFSQGHGGLQCEACHGSTHAEYTSSHAADNQVSLDTQGHVGTLSECSACHSGLKTSTAGGPHGLHTLGQAWVNAHGDRAEGGTQSCAYCHGADYRGGPLATTKAARDFNIDGRRKHYEPGQPVGCYDCHNGPGGEGQRSARR